MMDETVAGGKRVTLNETSTDVGKALGLVTREKSRYSEMA